VAEQGRANYVRTPCVTKFREPQAAREPPRNRRTSPITKPASFLPWVRIFQCAGRALFAEVRFLPISTRHLPAVASAAPSLAGGRAMA
jgi:hypothetical protein